MHPLFLLEEIEPSAKISKKGALAGSQLLEGVAGKKGDLFKGGFAVFTLKIN